MRTLEGSAETLGCSCPEHPAPVIRAAASVHIIDAEGDFTIPVSDMKNLEYDIVWDHLKNYYFMVNLAHFKGHAMGGFGGVIKNQSIGVASVLLSRYEVTNKESGLLFRNQIILPENHYGLINLCYVLYLQLLHYCGRLSP